MKKTSHILIATVTLLATHAHAADQPWTVYEKWPFDATEAKRLGRS